MCWYKGENSALSDKNIYIYMFNGASKAPINNVLAHSVYARYITCDLNLIRDFMPGKKQYKVRKRNISKCLSRTKM